MQRKLMTVASHCPREKISVIKALGELQEKRKVKANVWKLKPDKSNMKIHTVLILINE